MADNVIANAGSGGSTFATDDIGGIHYPRGKTSLGADGAATDAIGVSAALDSDGTGVQAVGVLGQFDDTSPATVTENQFAPVRISSRRALLVEGVASGTVIPVSDGAGSLTVDGTVTVQDGGGAVSVDDNGSTLSVDDGAGSLTVDGSVSLAAAIPAGTNNIGDVDVLTVPSDPFGANADAASATGSISAKLRFIAATGIPVTSVPSHAVTNAGTFAVQESGTQVVADDAAFTPGTTKVVMAGFQADEASTDSVDEGDGGAARMTLDRKVIVTPQPHTAGGLSIFRSLDLDETEEEVKGSAGCVYGCWVTNTATATRWLKFYNATAANVTVGSTTPVITIGLPGNSSDDISGNFGPGGMGIMFDTAITVAATTGVADADTGAPGANDVIVNIFYK